MSTERVIMVADTKTQKKYKITTNASTLGELKQCLTANNINYSGMSFTEGITKTTLEDDNSLLPTNIPYKGTTTNNLVLLLTNTKKNIASGMDRKEAYGLIKQYHLQDTVKSMYGRNFTQVPTSCLEEAINRHGNSSGTEAKEEVKEGEQKEEITGSVEEIKDCGVDLVSIIINLCEGLADKKALSSEDLETIAEALEEYATDLEDSDFDIDAMMASL